MSDERPFEDRGHRDGVGHHHREGDEAEESHQEQQFGYIEC
jgi:hypothetical protein